MFGSFYVKTRDKVEGARDVCETVWHDWPIMALGLVVRTRGSVPEDFPEVREYEDRETKRLRREYLRRRWRDGKPQAVRWYERRLADLVAELTRRREELSREELVRSMNRHKDDENLLFVVEDRRHDRGD
ncbi:MAG: hypothetical protein M3R38_01000 [Actinomycetota bacterium]|nr:hypothetical protein [Actinomycetota bacterium]